MEAGSLAAKAARQSTSSVKTATPLPSSFRRLVAQNVGKSFREVAAVKEVPLQRPGPGQVLIKLQWAGINGGCETFRVRGEHWFSGNHGVEAFPLGAEGSGIVVDKGPDVTRLQVGQPVAANMCAAFAEYALVNERMVTAVETVGPEAVALVLSAVTACAALEGTAKIQPGERVLVTAAMGGTGHFAVQLAKLAGCEVIAVCGGPHKVAAALKLGATLAIDYHSQDVSAVLSERYPQGVDVMYEGVGGKLRAALLPHLAPGGRLLQVGYISEYPHTVGSSAGAGDQQLSAAAAGGPTPAAAGSSNAVSNSDDSSSNKASSAAAANHASPAGAVPNGNGSSHDGANGSSSNNSSSSSSEPPIAELFWKGLDVTLEGDRRIIGSIWPKDPATLASCKRKVFSLYEQGQLTALVDKSHSFRGLDQVTDAVEHMLNGGHVGKVVIQL